jgi:hypothetical protein
VEAHFEAVEIRSASGQTRLSSNGAPTSGVLNHIALHLATSKLEVTKILVGLISPLVTIAGFYFSVDS